MTVVLGDDDHVDVLLASALGLFFESVGLGTDVAETEGVKESAAVSDPTVPLRDGEGGLLLLLSLDLVDEPMEDDMVRASVTSDVMVGLDMLTVPDTNVTVGSLEKDRMRVAVSVSVRVCVEESDGDAVHIDVSVGVTETISVGVPALSDRVWSPERDGVDVGLVGVAATCWVLVPG